MSYTQIKTISTGNNAANSAAAWRKDTKKNERRTAHGAVLLLYKPELRLSLTSAKTSRWAGIALRAGIAF
jgi:hypothetical protein